MSDTLTASDLVILSRIEWVFDWESGEDLCPECENTELQEHQKHCEFGALLARLRGPDWKPLTMRNKTEASIRAALETYRHNGSAAAKALGIPLRTFRRYCKNYGIRKRLT